MRATVLIAICALLAGPAAAVHGQDSRSASPSQVTLAATVPSCAELATWDPPRGIKRLLGDESKLAEYQAAVEKCVLKLDKKVPKQAPTNKIQTEINRELVDLQREHRRLRQWTRKIFEKNALQRRRLDAKLRGIRDDVRVLLEGAGLREPLSAQLVSGGMLSDASGEVTTSDVGNALAHIQFGSDHFFNEDLQIFDVSFGGRFGMQPTSTLVKPQESDDESETIAKDQQAVTFDLGFRANFPIFDRAELAVFGTTGWTRLTSDVTLVDNVDPPFLAIPLSGDTGRTARFHELGARLDLHRAPLERLHEEKDFLNPMFTISVGLRYDLRFKQEGELVVFDNPDERWFLRAMVNAIKVLDKRDENQPARTFTVSFGIDYEAPKGDDGVPAVTRFLIQGDINLLKALAGGGGG